MGNNIKIGYDNCIDSATIDATAAALSIATLPATNLKTIERGKIFRVKSGTANTITITFDAAKKIGCVAFWLATNNGTFTVKLYNGTSLLSTNAGVKRSLFFTPVTATKVVITPSSSVSFDISRIFVGNCFEPVNNAEFGLAMKYRDLSESERTEDGSLHIREKARFRILTFNLADISSADRSNLINLIQTAGTKNDVFVSVFSSELETNAIRNEYEMLGVFDDGAELALVSANRWGQKLVINEL